ncbi:MAG: 50S ribosomal protein L21 [Patescibacteria group bacterium]
MKLAVIQTGGKQYLVEEGKTIKVEKLAGTDGSLQLPSVLLVADDDKVEIGTPTLDSSKIEVTKVKDGRSKKVIVEKYKPKVRYHKRQGHRQAFSQVKINKIIL